MSFFTRKLVICWGFLVASPALLFSQTNLNPQGGEYRVVPALTGEQTMPRVAIDSTGGYMVWQDNAFTSRGSRIRAERLDGNFQAASSPFIVSSAAKSKIAGDQEKPQVALLQAGGAAVVWQGGKFGFQQIYIRFFNASGSPVKSDVRVSARSKNNQTDPGVATLADGSVVVVWSSFGQDGNMQGVFAQRFSAAGAKLGGEFQVSQATLNNQRSPSVAALADGRFVVVWISELQRGVASVDVYGRIFDAGGNPVFPEFAINASTDNICANPTVTGSPQGGFGVVWSQNQNRVLTEGSQNGAVISTASGIQIARSINSWDVFGSFYDAGGANTTAPFALNTTTHGDQFAPRISALGPHYLTVWTSLAQDGSREGVYGQLFSSGGAFEDSEFKINTTTVSKQFQPAVATDGVDKFLAVWSGFVARTSFDLFAQTYILSTP